MRRCDSDRRLYLDGDGKLKTRYETEQDAATEAA
jgi:hypothetical protein